MTYPVFTSYHSVGLTFLSWSYHWLAGHDQHWNSMLGFCKVPNNPNTGINAHHFLKNYRAGYANWRDFILDDKNNVENNSMYGGPAVQFGNKLTAINLDYANCLKFASQHQPVIFCRESLQDPWYFLSNRATNPVNLVGSLTSEDIELYQRIKLDNFLKFYYADDLTKFDKNIWDLRELIALNYDYFKVNHSYIDYIDRSLNCLYIDSKDLWYNGEECLNRIFKYLDKKISMDRLDQWKIAYREWQAVQLKILQFNWYFSTIIDSIINNYNFDLEFLNLTLLQESVIQGCLIKEHNLNLKCFGLVKFPNNTKDLHQLLEENIHK